MENLLYCIEQWQDYEGGGIISIFSTYEKAKEEFDKFKTRKNSGCSLEIVIMKIDDPDYKDDKTLSDYKRI